MLTSDNARSASESSKTKLEVGSGDDEESPARKKPKSAFSKVSASKSGASKPGSSKLAVISKAAASKLIFEHPEMNKDIPKHLLGTMNFAEGKGRVFLLLTQKGNSFYEISTEPGKGSSAVDFWSVIRARVAKLVLKFYDADYEINLTKEDRELVERLSQRSQSTSASIQESDHFLSYMLLILKLHPLSISESQIVREMFVLIDQNCKAKKPVKQ